MATNADAFLEAFRQIEAHLRRGLQGDGSLAFAELVRRTRDRVVNRYQVDLREYAELRNAIVHAPGRRVLAEPADETTSAIQRIRNLILAPPTIRDIIKPRDTQAVAPEASIREALLTMQARDYSQLPVYANGTYVALLTTNGIARWVAAMLALHGGMLQEAPVSDVLQHEEDPETVAFMGPSATALEAVEVFSSFRDRGHVLQAILVSEGARRDVRPISIVTVYDVSALTRAIQ